MIRTSIRLMALTAMVALSASANAETGPLARFGVISDIHILLTDAHRSEVLRLALEYLGGRKVDGVVACGDLTESGTIDELQEFARIRRSVFPVARSTATTPRAYDYEVQAVLQKALVTRIVSTKRVYSPKCYLAENRDANEVVCLFGRFEIPDDHDSITFVVRPLNAWGVFGAEIRSEPAAYDNVRARCWY